MKTLALFILVSLLTSCTQPSEERFEFVTPYGEHEEAGGHENPAIGLCELIQADVSIGIFRVVDATAWVHPTCEEGERFPYPEEYFTVEVELVEGIDMVTPLVPTHIDLYGNAINPMDYVGESILMSWVELDTGRSLGLMPPLTQVQVSDTNASRGIRLNLTLSELKSEIHMVKAERDSKCPGLGPIADVAAIRSFYHSIAPLVCSNAD